MDDANGRRSGRSHGATPRWGTPTVRTQVYIPDWLKGRIEQEALRRNVEAGDPSAWNYSSVAAATLLERFGGAE